MHPGLGEAFLPGLRRALEDFRGEEREDRPLEFKSLVDLALLINVDRKRDSRLVDEGFRVAKTRVADHHRLGTQLLEGRPFAVHLHRLLSAEDSAEVADEDKEGGPILRDLGESRVLPLEVLHEQFGHDGSPPCLRMRSMTGREPSMAVRCM